MRRWNAFRIDEKSAPSHLFQCVGTELGDSLLNCQPKRHLQHPARVARGHADLCGHPHSTGALRTELLQLIQGRNEPFRAFTARVRGKAETCEFMAECECGKGFSYTDHDIRGVLLNGTYDPDIRREVPAAQDTLKTPIDDVIALVKNKEMARNVLPSLTLSVVSTFQRQKNTPTPTGTPTPSHADMAKEATCPDCKGAYKILTEWARGWNTKPQNVCITCYRARRRIQRLQRSPQTLSPNVQVPSLSQYDSRTSDQ